MVTPIVSDHIETTETNLNYKFCWWPAMCGNETANVVPIFRYFFKRGTVNVNALCNDPGQGANPNRSRSIQDPAG